MMKIIWLISSLTCHDALLLMQATDIDIRTSRTIAKFCIDTDCEALLVAGNDVIFSRTGSIPVTRTVGTYCKGYISLVPKTEAPIESRVFYKWLSLISADLQKDDSDGPEMHVRLFSPDGRLKGNYVGGLQLIEADLGFLFDEDQMIALASTAGPHSYANQVVLWRLSKESDAVVLLDLNGSAGWIRKRPQAGIWINRQLYDGIHPETKGGKPEFWQ